MRENENTDWLEKIKELSFPRPFLRSVKSWEDIYHLVVFTVYKEPFEVLQESFNCLLKNDYPKEKIIVVLATEERAGEEGRKAAKMIKEKFQDKFFKFLITIHPANLEGEIPGKASNETWAVKKAKEKIIDPLGIPLENVILSSLDADTCLLPKYLSCLTYHYLTAKDPLKKSYQPIPLFTNNVWEVPLFSRVFSFSSTFWNTMNQASPEKLITFSSHSMSLKTLVEVGYKNPAVVSDDSHIFWQCFLKYNGDYKVEPLFYPVSMDALAGPSYLKTLKGIYKQQRRWAYGASEIPYVLFGFLKNKKISLRKKISYGLDLVEGHWSWATSSFIIFFLGWLPLVLGGPRFNQTVLSYNLPRLARNIMTIAMVGIIFSAYLTLMLLPPKPSEFKKWKYITMFLEWFIVPFTMIVIQPLPALDAQIRLALGKYMGFWHTPKFRKSHSR